VLWTFKGIQVANLATHTITPLADAPTSAMQPILAFSWPYLVYATEESGGATVTRIRDMRTGLERTIAAPGSTWSPMAIAGDTLFASTTLPDNSRSTLYEMDNITSGGSRWLAIATMAGAASVTGRANDRLVALGTVVWDRAEHRFVTFQSSSGASGMIGFSGNYVAVGKSSTGVTNSDLTSEQVVIYNTATLPVRT
jgi:hypothetical protein